ncbi:MAG TPA: adenylate/guanylate cyclase domain-containing protein [Pseudonocardiaceae bacterium]|jgi:class 3 adenylate cyclase/tetratricopeptide (TPR) repeat protein|nr:adenylate/guanylate cyclase domain-containing protein [Pseudonocardiaceae bacterium]
MVCPACAAELPAGAHFCSHCGTSVSAGAPVAEERRIVTLLFCDLVGSTELSGTLDPELIRAILLRYYALMAERVELHGGVVEKFIGDAVMAVFGLTATHEDDPRRALTAALAMMDALAAFNADLHRDHGVRLRVRIGVHTGEVVTTADPASRQALVAGEVVNIAARLEQRADPGEVLISAATARAAGPALVVADPVRVALKGVNEAVDAVRLVAVPPADPEAMRRFDVPFVGRERDLSLLDLAWRRVTELGDAQVLTLLGDAGIGKTRLAAEWLKRSGDTIGLLGTGRCQDGGAHGTLSALAECVAPLVAAAGSPDPVTGAAVDLLRAGLLLDGTPSPSAEDTSAALACVLTVLARERPVLLVVDDCHWAQPILLAVLDRLVEDLDRLPVLVLCLARPELIEAHPGWGGGRTNATTVTIAGLSTAESAVLAANFVEVTAHDDATTAGIIAQANGNPLYLEQLATVVTEQGAAVDQLPPNLHALLAARIDRLDSAERTVLRHAAVIGTEVVPDDLRRLAGDGPDCAPILRGLARRRLIESVPVAAGGPPRYRFVHTVTQRVAYEGLTKRRRGELHERYADHLLAQQASAALVGGHLARSYRCQVAVGPLDAHANGLRVRATASLAAAGASALRRVDLPQARALLGEAAALAEPGDPGRAECLQQLGEACLTLGYPAEAESLLRQALGEAEQHGQTAIAAHARLHLATGRRDEAALAAAADLALPIFTAGGDELGLARSRLILARSSQGRGRHAEALAVLDRALVHSVAAGADRELANTLGAIGLSLWHGPEPTSSAIHRCEQLLAGHGTDRRAVQATLGFPLTVLHAVAGEPALAATRLAETRQAMAALSYAESQVFRALLTGLVAVAADPADAQGVAAAALRESLVGARVLGAKRLIRPAALELARVWLAAGRWSPAEDVVAGLTIGADEPVELADLLGVRARISALRAESDEAVRLAEDAVAVAAGTDSTAGQALARLDLAHVRSRLGLAEPARAAARAARELFAAKGHLVGAGQALRLLTEIGGSTR